MRKDKRYMRVAAVLTIALGTGHIMQNGGAIAARFGIGDDGPPSAPQQTGPATQVALLLSPRVSDAPALSFIPGVADLRPAERQPAPLAQPGRRYAALETANDATPAIPVSPDCTPSFSATAADGAMVELSLSAPCHPHTTVRIGHEAIEFLALTDETGALTILVPALELEALFTAEIDGLETLEQRLEVPALAEYDRVAVSWTGPSGIELHAFEFGAGYQDQGHVWRGNARDVNWALRAAGGYSTLLGDPEQTVPAMAEVYTFPSARALAKGVVRLTVEAAVTGANCGSDVSGRAQQVSGGESAAPVDLMLAMPGCEASGEFLVLNNLFRDLKIAAR